MTKIAGSESISQKHGSEDPDPDPPQNVMDPEHCNLENFILFLNNFKNIILATFFEGESRQIVKFA